MAIIRSGISHFEILNQTHTNTARFANANCVTASRDASAAEISEAEFHQNRVLCSLARRSAREDSERSRCGGYPDALFGRWTTTSPRNGLPDRQPQ